MFRFKTTIAILLLAATLGAVLPLVPQRAHGAVLSWETNPKLLGEIAITSFEQTGETVQTLYEWAQEFVLEHLKHQLLSMMTDQIIQWIQGGGKPKFVTDWRQFLSDAANIAAGDFIEEIGLGFLCQPFGLQVQISLLPVGRFSKQVTCTLDQIVGNIENFYADFRNGSWVAYTGSLEPQNNYFGASLLAEAERERRKENARSAALSEGLSGGGFISTKNCQESPALGGPDLDNDGTPGDVAATCTVTVPATVIKNLTEKATGIDFDTVLQAEQLSEYVSAIANAIFNRLIVEGVNGIQGLATSNAPSGGAVVGGIGNCNGLSGTVLTACLDLVQNSQNSFDAARLHVLQNIQRSRTVRESADSVLQSVATELTNYAASLRNLVTLFQNLSCSNVSLCISKIDTELTFATSSIPAVQNRIAVNQAIIAQLDSFETQVNTVAAGNWSTLSTLLNQVQQSGAADLSQALTLEADARQELVDTRDRIAQTLQRFNSYLLQCQQNTPFACQ